jgi:hypothetical protein
MSTKTIQELKSEESENESVISSLEKDEKTIDENVNPMKKEKEKKPRSQKQIDAFQRLQDNNKLKFKNKKIEEEKKKEVFKTPPVYSRTKKQIKNRYEEISDEETSDEEEEESSDEEPIQKSKIKKIVKQKEKEKPKVLYF